MWTGAVSTDWNNPNNWTPAGIPSLYDTDLDDDVDVDDWADYDFGNQADDLESVYICGALNHLPVLTTPVAVLGISIEGGATLDLSDQQMWAWGDFVTGHDGKITMSDAAAELSLLGGVSAEALFYGGASELSAGTIHVGTFKFSVSSQSGVPSFSANGSHRVIFEGVAGDEQLIYFGDSGVAGNHFNEVEINSVSNVVIDALNCGGLCTERLDIAGDLFVSAGTLVGEAASLYLGGDLSVAGAANFEVLSSTIYGTAILSGNVTVNGSLAVEGPGALLTVGANTLIVNGSFSTQASGVLDMTHASGIVRVLGSADAAATVRGNGESASFEGGASILSAGTLEIGVQNFFASAGAFSASGTHLTSFVGQGTQGQQLQLESPSASVGANHFGILTLGANANRTGDEGSGDEDYALFSDVYVLGALNPHADATFDTNDEQFGFH